MTKLQKAQVEVKRLWNLMCEWEGIPYDSKFVVFNPNNKFSAAYNKAMTTFLRLNRAELNRQARRWNTKTAVA